MASARCNPLGSVLRRHLRDSLASLPRAHLNMPRRIT